MASPRIGEELLDGLLKKAARIFIPRSAGQVERLLGTSPNGGEVRASRTMRAGLKLRFIIARNQAPTESKARAEITSSAAARLSSWRSSARQGNWCAYSKGRTFLR
jgi:hypothetical protein